MARRPNHYAKDKYGTHGEAQLAHRSQVQGIADRTRLGVGAAGTDPALLEEAVIVALEKEGLDLAHGVEDDAHRDQHPGAAEEVGDAGRDVQLEEQDVRHYRDDR